MQRIQTADNRFAAGNPQLGTPGTIVTAKFLNDIQEEISNVIIDAGIELDGTAENQLSASIQKLISDRAMPFYSSIPSTKSNEVIYVIGIGVMEWRTFEWESSSWSGYATLLIGKYDYDTTELPRSMTIDALGDTFSKAQYPALWAWAQATGRVVSAASWINGIYRFVDLGSSFRVPDMRDQFIRATGTDADNANARALGSHQQDALQNITGYFGSRNIKDSNQEIGIVVQQSGAFYESNSSAGVGNNTAVNNSLTGSYRMTAFDASRVARTATETRSSNTALAPRLIAY